ncbi:MAG: cold-shock protein [Actinomycetota bacterium]
MPQATVKSYDSLTKTGELLADDGDTTYAITPEAIDDGMFRFLRPGQRVTFDLDRSEQGAGGISNLRIGIV